MKCPVCSLRAMSFGKSMVVLDPRRIRCRECHAKLELSRQWLSAFWVSISAAFVLGVVYALLNRVGDSGNGAVFLMVWIGVALCYDLAFWQRATYMPAREEGTNSV